MSSQNKDALFHFRVDDIMRVCKIHSESQSIARVCDSLAFASARFAIKSTFDKCEKSIVLVNTSKETIKYYQQIYNDFLIENHGNYTNNFEAYKENPNE